MFDALKQHVCEANHALVQHGLVTLTWGNASAIADDGEHVAIKPSGVSYAELSAEHIVVLDLAGNQVDGELKPSSDTPTHLELYRQFSGMGGVVHTHSPYATAFAQARVELPCLGTTHADHFQGPVPVARALSQQELDEGYEHNTGRIIVETFAEGDPIATPAVLLAGHAPFAWGPSLDKAVENAVALEAVAKMAHLTLALNPGLHGLMQAAQAGLGVQLDLPTLEDHILAKHYQRKHGPNAYYGQR